MVSLHGFALVANDWWLQFKRKRPYQTAYNKLTTGIAILLPLTLLCYILVVSWISFSLANHRFRRIYDYARTIINILADATGRDAADFSDMLQDLFTSGLGLHGNG